MKVIIRRTSTVTAVILAIVIGAMSIEAAAAAVRASAPPAGPASPCSRSKHSSSWSGPGLRPFVASCGS